MGTGCPPPVYVRVRRYGWRRREHAWTGGRVHRGPGAIATMMHAAARFKAASRRSRCLSFLNCFFNIDFVGDNLGAAWLDASISPVGSPYWVVPVFPRNASRWEVL